jgi:hypothetical protein
MHGSLLFLYRVFCQPTALAAQMRALRLWQRLRFMVYVSPAILAVNVLVGGPPSLVAQAAGLPDAAWLWDGGLRLALEALLLGTLLGVVWSVPAGVAWATLWGPTQWVLHLVAVDLLPTRVMAVTASSLPLGLAWGVALGVALRRPRYALLGVGGAVAAGTAVTLVAPAFAALAARYATDRFHLPAARAAHWRDVGQAVHQLTPAAIAMVSVTFVIGYFRLEWYVVDVLATAGAFAAAHRDRARARFYFTKSPIHWREPVWLPLLGLRPFLRLVGEEDFAAGVEECYFIISDRPNQARVARTALMEIVARHLAELTTVQQIAAAARELERARVEEIRLPGPVAEALPALHELARHAEQHLTTVLHHNQVRALERLRDGSEDLARKLTLARGMDAAALIGVARQWRAVAEARLDAIGREEAASGYIHNPFVFGQPIEETEANLFVGRRDTVREIEVSLLGAEQKPALVLWGPRRMGKTSVLLQLPRLLGPEFVPSFVDMQSMQVRESVTAFFSSLTAAASQAMRRRGIAADPLRPADMGASPFAAFAAWTEEAERRLGGERYLLLCLDEFERLEASIQEGRLPPELLDEIRHLIQHHPRIVLLFAGSHRPDEMTLNWPDTLISTKLIRVSYLAEEEARQLITGPVPEFAVGYQPGSVERILEVTRCQPYLVQAVCYELVNRLNAQSRREAASADVDAAMAEALESAYLYFAEMWRQLEAQQQLLLRRAGSSAEGCALADLAAAAGATPEQAELDLKRLQSRSILEQAGPDQWRFQVPMVAAWVRGRE